MLNATGLHIDNVRKLVTWGAVHPAKGGRGRGNVRMWSAHTVRHIACVSALVNSGLSVKMAHTLVYLDVLGDIFLDIIDPEALAMNSGDKYGWFDPKSPLDPQENNDFRLIVADGKYVYIQTLSSEEPMSKGLLADGGTMFRTSIDFNNIHVNFDAVGEIERSWPLWETAGGHLKINPSSLAWQYDNTLVDGGAIDWSAAYRSAVSITTVNLSLACKIAMRRLLDIPVFFPKHPDAGVT